MYPLLQQVAPEGEVKELTPSHPGLLSEMEKLKTNSQNQQQTNTTENSHICSVICITDVWLVPGTVFENQTLKFGSKPTEYFTQSDTALLTALLTTAR